MKKIWKIKDADQRLQKILSEELGITTFCAQLLINRGIRTPEQAKFFLFGNLSSCYDPFLMKDMEKCVLRIKKSISGNEKILLYGDYDVDGVTSVALLSYVLKDMGADVETFIPNRLEDGYGMNVRAVSLARDRGVDLIITVDCGVNSLEEIKCANDYGIDVIVTDHHEIKSNEMPPAYAIIDVHQEDCVYPFKDLAGVGVAYKLARALNKGNEASVDSHLDLVALGTIADVSPMRGENRVLVRAGIKRLNNTDKPGLKALINVAGIRQGSLNSRHIGFMLGPRINAMGRVASANTALELLLCDDGPKSEELARTLDRENKNRQAVEKKLLDEVVAIVKEDKGLDKDGAIVLAGEGWHPGVLGIVASRLADTYEMPSILISLDGEMGRGSGRSARGINLFESLSRSGDLLATYGGHETACGLKIEKKNIEAFKKSLTGAVKDLAAEKDRIEPELDIDMNLPFAHIGAQLIKEIELFAPFGPENVEPVFAVKGLTVKSPPRSFDRGGFKFLASCGNLTREVITFKKKYKKPSKGSVVDIAFTPSVNRWDGIETIQLNIKDIHTVD